jgi:hypothetical protein
MEPTQHRHGRPLCHEQVRVAVSNVGWGSLTMNELEV